MTKEELRPKLRDLFSQAFGEQRLLAVKDGVSPFRRGDAMAGLDSLDAVEFMMMIEDAFDIEISDQECMATENEDALVDLVHGKLARP